MPGDATPPAKAGRKEWMGLAVIAIPCLIYAMDLTVLHLAMPVIAAEFQPGAAELLWIVDIYGFMVAGFLITMGTLGDRIGRRKLLMIGAAAFGAASLLAAFADSAAMLIFARGVLGISAATLAPSTLSLIRNMFLDDRERTFAVGVWVACFSAGTALGPLVGGALIGWFWWGSVFLINVPFMLLLLAVGPILLPEFRDPAAGRIDLVSALMSLVAVLLVIYGLKEIAGGGDITVAALAVAFGLAIAALFIRRQFALPEPLLDLALLRSRALAMTLVLNLLIVVAAVGVFFFIAQYFQLVLGFDPFTAGLWSVPSGLAMTLTSMCAPVLVRHVRPARVIAAGFLLLAVAMGLVAQANGPNGFWFVFSGYLLMSLACGPIGTLTTDLVMSTAPPDKAGAASGISETSFEFGAAAGIAVLGSVVNAAYRHAMATAVPASATNEAAAAARDTLAGAVAVAAQLPHGDAQLLLAAARSAYLDAFTLTALLGMALALCGAAIAFRLIGTGAAPAMQKA
jgi:MFS transporter, DHA2 family, multidrug resistance protein